MPDENITNQTPNEDGKGGIFDILNKLMSNQGAAADSPQPAEKPAEANILSSLLSNPELLSKLPELISIISPLMSSHSSQNNQAAPAGLFTQSSIPKATPAHPQSHEAQNRSALLCALKPYLKKERQDAIDYMIKLSRLGDILKTL